LKKEKCVKNKLVPKTTLWPRDSENDLRRPNWLINQIF